MSDLVRDGTPLSSVDTAWLHMEDPTNLMMVTGLFVLDGPLSVDELRRTLNVRMTDCFPRLRHRVRQRGATASWRVDPHFDVASHVHRVGLPGPRGPESLRELVSDLMSTPLDFSKPLWQCHLIDDVGDGCAVVMRVHHCIGDGLALAHVLLSMTDNLPIVETSLPRVERRHLGHHLADRVEWLIDTTDAAVGAVFQLARGVVRIAHEGVKATLHPVHTLGLIRSAAEGARAMLGIITRPSDPRTQFKGPLGVSKRVAWSRPFPIDKLKEIGRGLGATINDVLLAAVAGGLRRYLESHPGQRPSAEIHAMVPVNLRPPEQAEDLGNRFGLVYLALPVPVTDPLARLRLVKERMDALKHSPEPLASFQVLNALGLAPREVADPLVNAFGSKATAVMTNVIGPKRPVYLCGRRIRDLMFWVPQSGRMGLGVSILSYDGRVTVGVATDKGLVGDPERIAEAFDAELAGLVGWAVAHQGAGLPGEVRHGPANHERRQTVRRHERPRPARRARP
jgi:WS/DGAT/MGAT family acyltransferase